MSYKTRHLQEKDFESGLPANATRTVSDWPPSESIADWWDWHQPKWKVSPTRMRRYPPALCRDASGKKRKHTTPGPLHGWLNSGSVRRGKAGQTSCKPRRGVVRQTKQANRKAYHSTNVIGLICSRHGCLSMVGNKQNRCEKSNSTKSNSRASSIKNPNENSRRHGHNERRKRIKKTMTRESLLEEKFSLLAYTLSYWGNKSAVV